MAKVSAGILLYRHKKGNLEVFLVHPGGPYWSKREDQAWSIPKGELEKGEEPLKRAQLEFHEETGSEIKGNFYELTPVKQPSGKIIHSWAVEGEFNPSSFKSNTYSMEWPPKSGMYREFPEVDRGEWFTIEEACKKIVSGQQPLLDQLLALVSRKA